MTNDEENAGQERSPTPGSMLAAIVALLDQGLSRREVEARGYHRALVSTAVTRYRPRHRLPPGPQRPDAERRKRAAIRLRELRNSDWRKKDRRHAKFVANLRAANLLDLPNDTAAMLREIDRIRNRTANMMLTYDKGEKIGEIIWPLDTATGPHGIRQVCRELGIETVGQLKRWYFDDKRRVQLQDALVDRHKLSAVADVVRACDEPLPRSTVAKPTYREVNDKISVIEQRPRPYTPQPKPAIARGANPLEKRMATLRTADDVETLDTLPRMPRTGDEAPRRQRMLEKMDVALADLAAGKKAIDICTSRGWSPVQISNWKQQHDDFKQMAAAAARLGRLTDDNEQPRTAKETATLPSKAAAAVSPPAQSATEKVGPPVAPARMGIEEESSRPPRAKDEAIKRVKACSEDLRELARQRLFDELARIDADAQKQLALIEWIYE